MPSNLIFGDSTLPAVFACFGISDQYGFVNKMKCDWEGDVLTEIESGQEIDPFNTTVDCMIEVPINQVGLMGEWFFFDGVVDDKNSVVGFYAAEMRLDNFPEVLIREFFPTEESGDLIMTEVGD